MARRKLGSTKRFGARYGRTLREKVAKIESVQRARHKCPYCNYEKVRRLASGIWECGKCNSKFTAKAYSPAIRTLKMRVEAE